MNFVNFFIIEEDGDKKNSQLSLVVVLRPGVRVELL